jgi:predicted lipoprotein
MRSRAPGFAAVAFAASLASCVPWTVRPIGTETEAASGPPVASPVEYVDSIWSAKLTPAVLNGAVEVRALLDALAASPADAAQRYGHREANGPVYFLVKGRGTVTAVDTRSRMGLALVDVAPYDSRADISIQIGPVLRGTALRDATGIVRFTDFINQLQFADVANELNARVFKTVLAPLASSTLQGRTVSFAGTASLEEVGQPPVRDLIPVKLTVEESR